MTSYRVFDKLQKLYPAGGRDGHGIRMRVANFFFDKPIEENAEEYEKMMEIEAAHVCLLLQVLASRVTNNLPSSFVDLSAILCWPRSTL